MHIISAGLDDITELSRQTHLAAFDHYEWNLKIPLAKALSGISHKLNMFLCDSEVMQSC